MSRSCSRCSCSLRLRSMKAVSPMFLLSTFCSSSSNAFVVARVSIRCILLRLGGILCVDFLLIVVSIVVGEWSLPSSACTSHCKISFAICRLAMVISNELFPLVGRSGLFINLHSSNMLSRNAHHIYIYMVPPKNSSLGVPVIGFVVWEIVYLASMVKF
uniref:Uncharacterized protein n=1 Tax=Spongospora subterranea TaxID=70186 RepID=A0A0H5R1E5_9EUKA|eukprot:CRZ08007.1 hypothetical protein [Spongospora subterranea]